MAAAVLVLALAVGVAVVALVSPAAHTISRPATAAPPPVPAAPATVPATLAEAWRAPSSATHSPVVVGGTVVTGDDSEVIGRDPSNGAQRWLYRRDLPLCTVGSGWGMALAVFRNGPWCSDVAALRADTGARGPQRNSDAPTDTRLLDDGFLVTSTGADHLETWRSDLVRTLEYGRLRAPVQPKSQPRPACVHGSVAVTGGRLGVVERCPGEAGDRLTVLSPDGAESDHPEEEFSAVLPATGARLVALSADREAVLLPGPPRLSVRGADGAELASYPLPLPEGDLTGDPPGEAVPTTRIPGAVLWWTGSRTIALDENDLRPRWTMPGALGPGALFADEPVLPVPDGLVVVNPANGAVLKRVPVHRDDRTGVAAAPLGLASVGPVLLEQRGSTLVALH
ncbi:MAG TPA: hypothetical protein VGH99_12525 [Pseudonocardia sp.]